MPRKWKWHSNLRRIDNSELRNAVKTLVETGKIDDNLMTQINEDIICQEIIAEAFNEEMTLYKDFFAQFDKRHDKRH